GGPVYQAYTYDLGTGRLNRTITQRGNVTPNTLTDTTYTYNPSGSITKIADTPPGSGTDTQCFRQDHLQRLTEAWTPASGDCTSPPATGAVGGPAPYWQSFTYEPGGNRQTRTDHTITADATTSYTYGPTQPHSLAATSGAATGAYTYDAAGNTLT